MSASPPERLLVRIRAAFLEMPDVRLKPEQVQRLCGVERTICQLVLDSFGGCEVSVREAGRSVRTVDGRRDLPSICSEGGPRTRAAFRAGLVTLRDSDRSRSAGSRPVAPKGHCGV